MRATNPTSPQLNQIIERWNGAEPIRVFGVHGSAAAWLLAAIVTHSDTSILIITSSQEAHENLSSDLKFFLSGHPDPPAIAEYPAWDVEPYDGRSPHTDITAQRLNALYQLSREDRQTIVTIPAEALLKRVLTPTILSARIETLSINEEIDARSLGSRLIESGYLSTDTVEEVGCLSLRGGIIDVFPPNHRFPVRIELSGDSIESIREFDPITQRSVRKLSSLKIAPAREEILTEHGIQHASRRLKEFFDETNRPAHLRRQIVQDMHNGIYFPGVEYHLGFLQDSLSSVFHHVQDHRTRVLVLEPDEITKRLSSYSQTLKNRFEGLERRSNTFPPPETLFVDLDELLTTIHGRSPHIIAEKRQSTIVDQNWIHMRTEPTSGLRQTLLAGMESDGMLQPLVERFGAWNEEAHTTYIACHSAIQAQRLVEMLKPYGINSELLKILPPLPMLPAPSSQQIVPRVIPYGLSSGFRFPNGKLVFLSDEDIFGLKRQLTAPSRAFLKNSVSSFAQLSPGNCVVHSTHGVGRFRGLTKLEFGQNLNDFLLIEYSGGDKLYLPVHRLNTLQKYTSPSSGTPKLDKMGGVTFARTKTRVKENLLKMAHDLLQLYAARAILKGHAFHADGQLVQEFASTFPYDETPDQLAAIDAVTKDLMAEEPMDRLICGDVGFGKTEVAVRAAFIAVQDGRQVAILVPTTILALQHFRTSKARFENFPINIEMLSRFQKPAQQREIISRMAIGAVDIVIGTHRLLSRDVQFRKLGLLIIDEEHRFGVRHKERIKILRKNLDILSMTATPIPRTLHMALTGLRKFSLIATPPLDRKAIRTFHVPFSPARIQAAVRFELKRGGQVFFVHNRVQSLNSMARLLKKLIPEAAIGVAHGQMQERALEKVMEQFIERQLNVLCCTTIIESGLDIPSANTMLINRSDRFGLAQLYQLRGRIGRSSRRAYCYLLTPANGQLSTASKRRLNTLVNFTELGAGFKIAAEDLEMRGAGNLLGSSQSGSINAVGFDMYCELLNKAIQELQGQTIEDELEPDIDLKVPSYFPEDYIPSLQGRLLYYKQLSDASNLEELDQRIEAILDRFGTAPQEAKNLWQLMEIRLLLKRLGVQSLSRTENRLVLQFDPSSQIDRTLLVALIIQQPTRYVLTAEQRLVVTLEPPESASVTQTLKNLLRQLR